MTQFHNTQTILKNEIENRIGELTLQELKNQVKIMRVPRVFEQVIGYDSKRSFRWVVIYFDADAAVFKKDKKSRINVIDTLQNSIKSASGNDIKQFKYKKLLNKLEMAHAQSKKKNIKLVPSQVDDPKNPWRVTDYQMDKGVSESGVRIILDNKRLNKVLDGHFGLPNGGFKKLFSQGKAVLLLDREHLEISAGGPHLIDIIDNISWKTKPTIEEPINEEIARETLIQSLNNAPLLISNGQQFKAHENIISLENFREANV